MTKGRPGRTRLGDILLRAGLVDEAGLARALDRQRMQPGRLGSHLLQLGLVAEDDLAKALAIQWGLPPFLPSLSATDPAAAAVLPEALARRLRAVPFAWDAERGLLQVALADPQDLAGLDELRFATGARKVLAQVAPEAVVERLLRRQYEGIESPETQIPEFSLAGQGPPPAPSAPHGAAGPPPSHREAWIADPDGRRRRALASLFEAAGYRVSRLSTPEELKAALGRKGPHPLWCHDSWAGHLGEAEARLYREPVEALDEALGPSRTLREEALLLAEDCARLVLGPAAAGARKAVSLVRFLAGRRGIEGTASDLLVLRAWRAALAGWAPGRPSPAQPGDELLEAVKAYERALAGGAGPGGAVEALRADTALDPAAVTSVLRWVSGEDLLSRFESLPRLLVVLGRDRSPAVAARLTGAGWEVECHDSAAPGPLPDPEGRDAVLAAMEPGLRLLEQVSQLPGERRPPLVLLTDAPAAPDTMYALRLGAEDVLPYDTHPEVLETKLRRAASRRAPQGGSVRGSLADMSLADTLQILSNGLKTAVLYLEGPEGAGQVALSEGQIVDARTGHLVGEDALYALLRRTEGSFRIAPGERPPEVTVGGSTEGLLMEGFRRLDEERRDAEGDQN